MKTRDGHLIIPRNTYYLVSINRHLGGRPSLPMKVKCKKISPQYNPTNGCKVPQRAVVIPPNDMPFGFYNHEHEFMFKDFNKAKEFCLQIINELEELLEEERKKIQKARPK